MKRVLAFVFFSFNYWYYFQKIEFTFHIQTIHVFFSQLTHHIALHSYLGCHLGGRIHEPPVILFLLYFQHSTTFVLNFLDVILLNHTLFSIYKTDQKVLTIYLFWFFHAFKERTQKCPLNGRSKSQCNLFYLLNFTQPVQVGKKHKENCYFTASEIR